MALQRSALAAIDGSRPANTTRFVINVAPNLNLAIRRGPRPQCPTSFVFRVA